MNENFKHALEESGMSMYAVSKRTAIPYTTINELNNCKTDINKCSAATVFKLSAVLKVRPEKLLNEIMYLDGVSDKYNGIRYTWLQEDTTKICFIHNGEKVVIDTGKQYNLPEMLFAYKDAAEWLIGDYLESVEWHRFADEYKDGLHD